jgi:hypothetical protein
VNPLHALIIALSLTLQSPTAHARAGWDHGNPGDTVVREFTITAQDIFNRMKLLPESEREGVDMNKFQGAILNAEIVSRDRLVEPLNDNEVPAMNFPSDNKIVINRRLWPQYRSAEQTENRFGLVLHEFLMLMRVDDDRFLLSNKIVAKLNVGQFNSGRFWNSLNPVNRISTSLIFNPGDCALKGFNFDTEQQEEVAHETTTGDCGEAYRSVTIRKTALQAPPSSGWRGIFHRFEITVADGTGKDLGQTIVEPEWGRCLLPQDGGCEVGGKIFIGGVEFRFWFQR